MMQNSKKTYKILPFHCAQEANVKFKTISPGDIENIRVWRNAQKSVLRQNTYISQAQQQNYFRKSIWPDMDAKHPNNILFSLFLDEIHIGYGGLVHIDWINKNSEVSFLLDPTLGLSDPVDPYLFHCWLKFTKYLAFSSLNLHKLTTETFCYRESYVTELEKFGFVREATLKEQYLKNGKWVNSIKHGLINRDSGKIENANLECFNY